MYDKEKVSILDKGRIIIGIIATLILGGLALTSFFSKLGNTEQVEASVIQSINYKRTAPKSKKIEYKSLITLKFKLNNKEYKIQKNENGTIYKGDTMKINIDKNNPTTLKGSSPYIDLICSLFFFLISFSLIVSSEKVKNIIKKAFYKRKNKYQNEDLYIDIVHEKKTDKAWNNIVFFLGESFLIICIIGISIYTAKECVDYLRYTKKQEVSRQVVVKNIDNIIVGSWKENNIEHLDYICMAKDNDIYCEGDKVKLLVEKNTEQSRKISTIPKISSIIKSIIGIAFLTFVLILCIVEQKKNENTI